MRTKFAILAALTAIAGIFVVAPAGAAPVGATAAEVGPAHAPCGTTPSDKDPKENVSDPARSTANQRTGSSTSCTSRGQLQPTDNADYYCFTWDLAYDYSWTYLRNTRTGIAGWVRDDLLKDNGSFVIC